MPCEHFRAIIIGKAGYCLLGDWDQSDFYYYNNGTYHHSNYNYSNYNHYYERDQQPRNSTAVGPV